MGIIANLDIRKYYEVAFHAFSIMVDLPHDVKIELDKNVLKKKFEELPVVYKKDKEGNFKKDAYDNSVVVSS